MLPVLIIAVVILQADHVLQLFTFFWGHTLSGISGGDCGNNSAGCIQVVQTFGGGCENVEALAGRGQADFQRFYFVEKMDLQDLLTFSSCDDTVTSMSIFA